jgi:hypothetical protein
MQLRLCAFICVPVTMHSWDVLVRGESVCYLGRKILFVGQLG